MIRSPALHIYVLHLRVIAVPHMTGDVVQLKNLSTSKFTHNGSYMKEGLKEADLDVRSAAAAIKAASNLSEKRL